MDLLQKEIARQKAEAKKVAQGKTYFKRGQLQELEKKRYLEEQHNAKKIASVAATAAPASFPGGRAAARDATGGEEEEDTGPKLEESEVTRRLRRRGKPVRLFGESLEEARARLRELEITEPELDDRQRNDFQDAMANVDEEYIQELLKKQGQGDDAGPAKKELRYTWSDMLSYRDQIGKGDAKIDQRLIRRFLKFLLDLWEIELAARPEEVRRTTEGRTASATLKQTINYIHPLFASLKSKTTEELVLNAVREIVIQMLSGEYIRANDAYLRFAIGNAPWPIGVTSVGIHSRTGREKIFAHNIAHVLNDETQRKYIQALKRLMTFCQNRFPSDPSKSLEFKATMPNMV